MHVAPCIAPSPATPLHPFLFLGPATPLHPFLFLGPANPLHPFLFLGPANLSGLWMKVPELSQIAEYEKVLDLWEISGMQKATAKLIEGLEIQHVGNKFHVRCALCFLVPEITNITFKCSPPSTSMARTSPFLPSWCRCTS